MNKSFSWEKHLDPNNEEFYKEGNHKPPAPFIEVAKNPSDRNISLWLRYLDTKSKLAKRLQSRINEYISKNNNLRKIPPKTLEGLKYKQNALNTKDYNRFRLRMYFESTCPHCKRMMQTLYSLQKKGLYVEAMQLNKGSLYKANFPLKISHANPEDVKKHNITSVPFVLIADLKSKVISEPIKGYQTPTQIENIVQLLKSKN